MPLVGTVLKKAVHRNGYKAVIVTAKFAGFGKKSLLTRSRLED